MILNVFIHKMPKKLPPAMEHAVRQLKKTKGKEECLHKAYNILTKRFRGKKFYAITHFWELFTTDMNVLWNKKNILHCTTTNYLLKVLLVKSGKFTEKDIKNRWTLVGGISLHQYLQVKLNKKPVNMDLWGHAYGIPFGKYAH